MGLTVTPSPVRSWSATSWAMDTVHGGVIYTDNQELELIKVSCLCGADIVGGALPGKVEADVALFEAHHRGPQCSPTWESIEWPSMYPGKDAQLHPRLMPDRICGSAWWLTRKAT